MSNNFHANDEESREKELLYLPLLYQHLAGPDGSYFFAHGESKQAQALQQHGIDVQVKNGKLIWYEDKFANWPKPKQRSPGQEELVKPYEYFCLETLSCSKPGKQTDGWMHTSRADRLTYCFEQHLPELPIVQDVYVILHMQRLKKWFWSLDLTRYNSHTETEGNCTRSVLIPIAEVLEEFPDTQRYLITDSWIKPVRTPAISISNLKPAILKCVNTVSPFIDKAAKSMVNEVQI